MQKPPLFSTTSTCFLECCARSADTLYSDTPFQVHNAVLKLQPPAISCLCRSQSAKSTLPIGNPWVMVTDADSLYDYLQKTGSIPKERQTLMDLMVGKSFGETYRGEDEVGPYHTHFTKDLPMNDIYQKFYGTRRYTPNQEPQARNTDDCSHSSNDSAEGSVKYGISS